MRDTTVMTNLCRFSICLFALLATAGAPLDSARAAYNCPITYTSCNANYYYSSGTCTACSSLTGSYALKDGANTNGSGSCYKTCAAAGTCTNCTLSRVAEKVYYPSGACSYALSCGAGYYGSSHGKNITTNTAGCTACTNSPSNAATWSRTGASTSATGCAVNITACNTGYSVSNNNTSAATCTLGAYAVTLDANGGTAGTTTSVTATYYAVLPAVAVAGLPKRAGYTFNGYWSAQSGGTQYIYAGGAATENKWTTAAAGTIYAQWAACGGNNYYCSGAAYNSKAAVSSGYYSTGGTDTTRTGQSQCSGAYWCSGGVQTECPAQTTGWTRNTGAGWTAFGSCNETKTGTAISAYCNAGVLKHTAGSSSAWSGTATIETPLQAKAGAYVNAQTCAQCAKGSYAEAIGTQTSCTACQPNEATTSAPGATSMISCFVPASENLTDSKGTYNFSTDCSWTQ